MQPENQSSVPDNNSDQTSSNEQVYSMKSGDSAQVPSVALNTPAVAPSKKGFLKKIGKTQVIAIVAVLVIAFSAGAYFGLVVPNKPENVWNTALENTAKGIDKLSDYAKQNKEVKGAKIKGTFKVEASGVTADGSFEGEQSEKNGSYKADVGAAGSRVNMEVLTNIPDGATTPDVYLKVKGLGSLGSLLGATEPEVASLLNTIDNQWYVLDHTAFDQLSSSATGANETMPQLSADDILAIEQVISKVNKEYLFTTDQNKAVLRVVKFVGKENIDGRVLYHYQVSVNKEHLKAHLTALKDALKNTKISKLYPDQSFEQAIGFDDLLKSVDNLNDEDQAAVWVDNSTKLIRKVRFNDDKTKSYLEFAVNYNGGSTYPFQITLHSDEEGSTGTAAFKLELDSSKNTLAMEFNADYPNQAKATMKATVEKSDDEVSFTKPTDAKSILELIGQLSGGNLTGTSPLGGSSPLGNFDL